jgi:hypothetical protein
MKTYQFLWRYFDIWAQGKLLDKEYFNFLEEFNDGLGFVASTPPPTTFFGKMSVPNSQAFVHDIVLSF